MYPVLNSRVKNRKPKHERTSFRNVGRIVQMQRQKHRSTKHQGTFNTKTTHSSRGLTQKITSNLHTISQHNKINHKPDQNK